ncbi:MAG: DNA-formamidopyrimidine glycosylase, partial [Gammaproteobacteria bacterium]|nr:DNA-formamidopyrimidine glycosylase [Gammaproteobacteria bacterium]
MPELPEVETTRRGIRNHLLGQRIEKVILRETRLRWPISAQVSTLAGRRIREVSRRGKYILMELDRGNLIWHLGMSGSMRILPVGSTVADHEHVELQLGNAQALKYRD